MTPEQAADLLMQVSNNTELNLAIATRLGLQLAAGLIREQAAQIKSLKEKPRG